MRIPRVRSGPGSVGCGHCGCWLSGVALLAPTVALRTLGLFAAWLSSGALVGFGQVRRFGDGIVVRAAGW